MESYLAKRELNIIGLSHHNDKHEHTWNMSAYNTNALFSVNVKHTVGFPH